MRARSRSESSPVSGDGLVAILPSRDEATTIDNVVRAVDRALGDERALIVPASGTSDTVAAFRATPPTRARALCLAAGLPRGQRRQTRPNG